MNEIILQKRKIDSLILDSDIKPANIPKILITQHQSIIYDRIEYKFSTIIDFKNINTIQTYIQPMLSSDPISLSFAVWFKNKAEFEATIKTISSLIPRYLKDNNIKSTILQIGMNSLTKEMYSLNGTVYDNASNLEEFFTESYTPFTYWDKCNCYLLKYKLENYSQSISFFFMNTLTYLKESMELIWDLNIINNSVDAFMAKINSLTLFQGIIAQYCQNLPCIQSESLKSITQYKNESIVYYTKLLKNIEDIIEGQKEDSTNSSADWIEKLKKISDETSNNCTSDKSNLNELEITAYQKWIDFYSWQENDNDIIDDSSATATTQSHKTSKNNLKKLIFTLVELNEELSCFIKSKKYLEDKTGNMNKYTSNMFIQHINSFELVENTRRCSDKNKLNDLEWDIINKDNEILQLKNMINEWKGKCESQVNYSSVNDTTIDIYKTHNNNNTITNSLFNENSSRKKNVTFQKNKFTTSNESKISIKTQWILKQVQEENKQILNEWTVLKTKNMELVKEIHKIKSGQYDEYPFKSTVRTNSTTNLIYATNTKAKALSNKKPNNCGSAKNILKKINFVDIDKDKDKDNRKKH